MLRSTPPRSAGERDAGDRRSRGAHDDDPRLDDARSRQSVKDRARLPDPARRRDRRRRPRREHGPRLRRGRQGAGRRRTERSRPGSSSRWPARRWCRPSAERAARSGAPRSAAPAARWATREEFDGPTCSPRSTPRSTVSSSSAPPSRATRRWSTRSAPASTRCAAASTRASRSSAALAAATAAAEEGARATVPLQARKGRASYLGERSIGHQDPGRDLSRARSCAALAAGGRAGDADERAGPARRAGVARARGRARAGALPSLRAAARRRFPRPTAAPRRSARARALAARGGRARARSPRRLRASGRADEAEIVETGALMAADPLLDAGGRRRGARRAACPAAGGAARRGRRSTPAAIAALPDPVLAARADDVRSLGRRAARHRRRDAPTSRAERGDVHPRRRGPRARRRGRARRPASRASRSPAARSTAHAAIVARSLGIPMVVQAGRRRCSRPAPAAPLVVDGAEGEVVLDAVAGAARRCARGGSRARDARARAGARRQRAARRHRRRPPVRVLVNAAAPPRSRPALAAGAEGVGLIRTELAFLDAPRWPTEAEHARDARARCSPAWPGRTATVRVLDFGGDKIPPFLAGTSRAAGSSCCSAHPGALARAARGDRCGGRRASARAARSCCRWSRGAGATLVAVARARAAARASRAGPVGSAR